MSSFIDIQLVGNHNKNEFNNKRRLLICGSCYWCSSYLPDLENENDEYFDDCPMCNEEIKSMFISDNASKRIDSKHIQHIVA
jgi:hypothetical protein